MIFNKQFISINYGILLCVIISSMATSTILAEPVPSDIETVSPPPVPAPSNRFGISKKGLSIISINDLDPGIIERAKSIRNEYETKGHHLTSDAEIARFSLANMSKAFVPIDKVNRKLSKGVRNAITTSPFGAMTLEGVIPANKLSEDKIYGLSRIYTLPDKSFFMLKEIDLASGVGIAIPAEAINADVNGYPAVLNVMKSKEGNSVTTLTWVTDTNIFTMYKSGTYNGKGQTNKLLTLAKTIQ